MVRNQIRILVCALFCSLFAGAAWADGAVYAMTNALDNNEIVVYTRAADGAIVLVQTIATGGGGSGLQLAGVDSLGSAGSLQLDEGHHLLFAVNTQSAAENNGSGAYNTDCQQGTITSFVVASDGTLTFADRVFSGGLFPNSLTVQSAKKGADLLYVLNAGGPEPPAICNLQPDTANTPNITGFAVDSAGIMSPIGSTQPIDPGPAIGPANSLICSAESAIGFATLTGANAADFQCGLNPPSFPRSPAQVRFSPDGSQLVVTVKGTNVIYIFPINKDGTAGDATTIPYTGPALPTPFGITFDASGHLIVVETFGTATSIPAGGAGAVSSFNLTTNKNKTFSLVPISSSVGDGATAPCCIALEPINGLFAYVANNLSASISSYTVGTNGAVTLFNGTAASGAGPNDLATAVEGNKKAATSFLYVLFAGSGTVGAFHINGDGSLTAITGGGGLPAGRSAQGLAAY